MNTDKISWGKGDYNETKHHMFIYKGYVEINKLC